MGDGVLLKGSLTKGFLLKVGFLLKKVLGGHQGGCWGECFLFHAGFSG